jgi:hypothetical protein
VPRTRSILLAVLFGGLVWSAGATAAQGATVTPDHPCYYSFSRTQQNVRLRLAGFRPGIQVNLTFLGRIFHTNRFTDAAGRVQAQFPAPSFRGTRTRISLTASDGTSSALTRFSLTDVRADFSPSRGSPARKVRFRITGLGSVLAALRRNPHSRVYAHYIRPNGRLKGTRKFGRLGGPCGDLVTSRTPLLPYAAERGTWTVYFDANQRYIRSERAQVLVTFKVS